MKKYLFLLCCILPVILTSCTTVHKRRDYRLGKDGLLYNSYAKELYTGRILDTTDVIIQYEVVNGKQNGKFITHYLNGNVEKTGFIINNKNEGEWQYYYANGQLESKGLFENNKASGEWKYYYPDGSIKRETSYVNGKAEGAVIYYEPSGKILNILYYHKGEITGSYKKLC